MTDAPDVRTQAVQQDARHRVLVEVEPHRWALSWWARLYRRLAKPWTVQSHIKKFCRPFTVEGAENLDGLQRQSESALSWLRGGN